tara:strand:+ start:63 stop:260 length:198 start_codon:yes stop_codon:yes gene_type:complete
MDIKETVPRIAEGLNITERDQVDNKIFYNLVKALCPEHWNRLVDPKASVRYYIQRNIRGYRNSTS